MAQFLSDPSHVPGLGWRALQPETGAIISGLAMDDLRVNVLRYREANGLPVEVNFRRQLEDQICMAMDPEERERKCRPLLPNDQTNPPYIRKFRSGLGDLENFAKAVKSVLDTGVQGDPVSVSQQEADRRAEICSTCPFNLPLGNCWSCGALGNLYRGIAGGKYSHFDGALQSCDVCGCDNRTQIHFSKEVLNRAAGLQGFKKQDFPDKCWKKELLDITSS
jgi:hypothetical protein